MPLTQYQLRLTAGLVVAERYELVRLLGEGSMGSVWSATHQRTRKPAALKFLKNTADPVLLRRFVREARATSAVRHPNVVSVHDILQLDGGLALVMDLLEGESLAERLRRQGALSLQELASIMTPVLSAVAAVHAAGIVHRDLKPDNIFLVQRGDGSVEPMLLDFGICKLKRGDAVGGEKTQLTNAGQIVGTPCYMAPEQILADKDADVRVDAWALGVILYECATGKRPFDGESLPRLIKAIVTAPMKPVEELAPQLPPPLAKLIGGMLTRERALRHADLREASELLRGFVEPTAAARKLQIELKAAPRAKLVGGAMLLVALLLLVGVQAGTARTALKRFQSRARSTTFMLVGSPPPISSSSAKLSPNSR